VLVAVIAVMRLRTVAMVVPVTDVVDERLEMDREKPGAHPEWVSPSSHVSQRHVDLRLASRERYVGARFLDGWPIVSSGILGSPPACGAEKHPRKRTVG
jgi:hypothetical protein